MCGIYTVQQLEYDGRFSFGNKAWAKGYEIPEDVSRWMDMNADYMGLCWTD